MGTPKPPVSTLKPRRTAASIDSGLWAVIQIGGRGGWSGGGESDGSGVLKNLPSQLKGWPAEGFHRMSIDSSPPARPLSRPSPGRQGDLDPARVDLLRGTR